MLLKALPLALALFAGGAGILRASVVLENWLLLAGGVALSAFAVLMVGYEPRPQRRRVAVTG